MIIAVPWSIQRLLYLHELIRFVLGATAMHRSRMATKYKSSQSGSPDIKSGAEQSIQEAKLSAPPLQHRRRLLANAVSETLSRDRLTSA